LDGEGRCNVQTGVGFFDHMLHALARHGMLDLEVSCKGDLQTGSHHTIEDVGIVLGLALAKALGDKTSIVRYGSASVPMDEALATCSLDVSGRAYLVFQAEGMTGMLDKYEVEATEDFFRAVSSAAGITLHILHPPLTRTVSSSPLPVPPDFMADPEKVGRGLAKNLGKKSFIICHSGSQRLRTSMAYRFPIGLGKLMSKMAGRAQQTDVQDRE
jgi:hypothetical protein